MQGSAQGALLALARVDTPRTAPAVLDLHVLVTLVTLEAVGLLLDDRRVGQRGRHLPRGEKRLPLWCDEQGGKQLAPEIFYIFLENIMYTPLPLTPLLRTYEVLRLPLCV